MKPIFLFLIVLVTSCTKAGDHSYLNTDRRPQVTIISQRFTNPPKMNPNHTWKADTVVYYKMPVTVDPRSYENLKPDTIVSTCAIGGIDARYTIEIRSYSIKY